MNVKEAYNQWASIYDSNSNKTRDLEGYSLRKTLKGFSFKHCLEIGCGTGKNSIWLHSIAKKMMCIDLSEKMIEVASQKLVSENVKFQIADITNEWDFTKDLQFDLITFSLVLEHIENLQFVFEQLNRVLEPGGHVYIGELHPFKQYSGTKARYETDQGTQIVTCFNHNISDFTSLAFKFGFDIISLDEYFDDEDQKNIPRILTLLLRKK